MKTELLKGIILQASGTHAMIIEKHKILNSEVDKISVLLSY